MKKNLISIAILIILSLSVVKYSNLSCFEEINRYRVTSNESVWKLTKHGDLAAYSQFIHTHLFNDINPNRTLYVPDREKTDVPFARNFWLGVSPLYLFPTEVDVLEYDFLLTDQQFSDLNQYTKKSYSYGKWTYIAMENETFKDSTNWGIFIYIQKETVYIFTLPFELLGTV